MNTFDWSDLESRFQHAVTLPGAEPGDANWWTAWREHLRTRTAPRWFYSVEDAAQHFRTYWPALCDVWVDAANAQLDDLTHVEFKPVRLANGDVDWGANPTKTMSWAGFHYWSWANPLIRGYAITHDERMVGEVASHVRSYFEQMDTYTPEVWEGADLSRGEEFWRNNTTWNDLAVGIKLVTFAEALMVFATSESWSVDDARRATLLMVRHAESIHAKYDSTGHAYDFLKPKNFLTSGASGLGAAAVILPECAWAAAWQPLATEILETHLEELFYSDGGHRESCTQYHKAGIRDIVFYEQILAANGGGHFAVREPFRTRLLGTLRWLTSILQPDGTTAVLNSAAASNDWLIFVLVANKWLRDAELNWHVRRWFSSRYIPRQKIIPALAVRFIGTEDKLDYDLPETKPTQLSRVLPTSGVVVLRDSHDRLGNMMTVDFCRPVGGHAYPARGSFSLYLNGRPAALSPGSPNAYTDPAYRGWMHTSRSQNNVLIDDIDQAQFFTGRKRVGGEILLTRFDADTSLVQGTHDGYTYLLGIKHTRTILMLHGRGFLVHDLLDATAADADHEIKWSIHCPESLEEVDRKAAVSPGLMRVTPAWPHDVARLEIGREGKAVYPADSDDGRTDTCRVCTHARWVVPLGKGECRQVLMFIQDDGPPVQFGAINRLADQLLVPLKLGGVTQTVMLPTPYADDLGPAAHR